MAGKAQEIALMMARILKKRGTWSELIIRPADANRSADEVQTDWVDLEIFLTPEGETLGCYDYNNNLAGPCPE
ncbi:hypothetical protein D0Z06_24205 [Geodermatophilus marinus]|nr:hypothetical protein D0Z06_24205 [Geodermatophilus sp. LHW52908]